MVHENCVFAVAKSNFAVTIAGVSKFHLVVVFLNTMQYSTGCIISAQLFHVSVSGHLDQKQQKGLVESVIDVQYHYEPTSLGPTSSQCVIFIGPLLEIKGLFQQTLDHTRVDCFASK